METLRRRLVAFCNRELSELGELALREFCRLPGSESWDPQGFMGIHHKMVFDHGLPLALIANNLSAEPHRRKIASALFCGTEFPKSMWSEVHACALLTHWGFAPRFVKVANGPTPDIELTLEGGMPVDVEVARAEFRREHSLAFDHLGDLLGALRPQDIACDLLLFFQDASNLADVNELFDAAIKLKPGEFSGRDRRWFARATPIGNIGIAGGNAEDVGPEWWSGGSSLLSSSILIGGANQPTPTIQVRTKPPTSTYEGPIKRKANSGQWRPGRPYLIAVDMTEVIGWRDRVAGYLDANFPIWPHVAGVLVFEARFYSGPGAGKCYVTDLFVNGYADCPLPKELVDRMRRQSENHFSLESDCAPIRFEGI